MARSCAMSPLRAGRSFAVGVAIAATFLAVPAASFAAGPLAGWWPMNEGSGQTVHDWSGNDNDGTLGTTPGADAQDPIWIAGVTGGAGRALAFDGADDVISVPRSSSLEPKRLTVATWVRSGLSPGPFRHLVSKGGSACDGASYGLYSGSADTVAFYIFDGTNAYVSPPAAASVWNGAWHHVAGTFDGSRVRLYVDGKQAGAGTPVPAGTAISYPLPNSDGTFGNYANNCGLAFRGDIDTVRIWNVALPVDLYWAIARSLLNR
jgi:Concanavalin A-like lectin/glucanases superfamily